MELLRSDKWDWYNQLSCHSIYGLVALSLGLDPDRCLPHGWSRPKITVEKPTPPKFGERSVLTYDAARAGLVKLIERKAMDGAPFDADADVQRGQFWEITTLSFRQFCDLQGWDVPSEFQPVGYVGHTPNLDAGGVAATRRQGNDTKGKRTTVLSPVIEDAITECESDEIARVWAKLEEWAGLQRAPFVGVVKGKGLKYMDTGEKIYSRGALRSYLYRRAEALAAAR